MSEGFYKPAMPNGEWIAIEDFQELSENAPSTYWAAWDDLWNVEIVHFSNLRWLMDDGVHDSRTPKWVWRLERPQHPQRSG